MPHYDISSTIHTSRLADEGLPGGHPVMNRTTSLPSSSWKLEKSDKSWGSGASPLQFSRKPPNLVSPRGHTSHTQVFWVTQACEVWPRKVAFVSLSPAPNTRECAGLSCTPICTCIWIKQLGMGSRYNSQENDGGVSHPEESSLHSIYPSGEWGEAVPQRDPSGSQLSSITAPRHLHPHHSRHLPPGCVDNCLLRGWSPLDGGVPGNHHLPLKERLPGWELAVLWLQKRRGLRQAHTWAALQRTPVLHNVLNAVPSTHHTRLTLNLPRSHTAFLVNCSWEGHQGRAGQGRAFSSLTLGNPFLSLGFSLPIYKMR